MRLWMSCHVCMVEVSGLVRDAFAIVLAESLARLIGLHS